MMKLVFLICFLPTIFSSPSRNIQLNSDEDCSSSEFNRTIEKNYAALIKFSPNIAYGKDSCSVYVHNPWLANIQNGFGLFISGDMDCASILTIDCLPDSTSPDQMTPTSEQYTCHTSKKKLEMHCNSIRLTFKRNIRSEGIKKSTSVQVVALAKEPCNDNDIFFRCPDDYPNSCIDKKLQCNGRSECSSGRDEYGCHTSPSDGIPWIIIILLVVAFLILICVISSVLICCCCRAAFNKILRRFQSRKGNKSVAKGDVTVTGEDAGLIKELTAPSTVVEILPQQHMEPAPLMIDSTKPIYPRLE